MFKNFKPPYMKANFTQQEILLMTNTTFSQRQWCEKENTDHHGSLSCTEQLEDACWNGVIYEMFPGIVEKSAEGKRLYLWQIYHGTSFLQLELCEQPRLIDLWFSINPHAFIPTVLLS